MNVKEIEQKLDSREVAKMMEVEHKLLLRKIDNINEDFSENKIVPTKYWNESSYLDKQNKPRRNFLITKRGCEFLAHKTTGAKGNLFTDRYMDRFEEMKNCIQNNQLNTYNNGSIDLMEQMNNLTMLAQGMTNCINGITNYVQDSIRSKDLQIEQTMDLIGLRSVNAKRLSNILKDKLENKYGYKVYANSTVYKKALNKVFNEYNVIKWEDIPVNKYNSVQAYIEEVI